MKKVKGIAAFAAAVMALNSATIVFADTGAKGLGSFEGNVSTNVFSVELPTVATADENGYTPTLKFILDPNDLIIKSNKARYSGIEFSGDKGFYFYNEDGNYSAKSDELVATNKGSTKVNVSINAKLSDYTGINLVDADSTADNIFGESKTPDICVNLKSADASMAIATNEGATLIDRIDGADDSAFILSYNTTTDQYEYKASSLVSADAYKSYTFWLTGAANKAGDWSTLGNSTAPKLDLVWDLTEYTGDSAPTITETSIALNTSADSTLNYTLGLGDFAATAITNLSIVDSGNSAANALNINNGTDYVSIDATAKTITIKKALATTLQGGGVANGKIRVTFNNAKSSAGEYPTTVDIPFTVS